VKVLRAAAVVLCLGGCATIESGGFKVDQAETERAFEQVKARAAWDFRCAPEGTEVVVLGVIDGGSWNDTPAQIGATGCGQRAVYVLTRSGWVMNNAVMDLRRR
jgi:hypothetical protein